MRKSQEVRLNLKKIETKLYGLVPLLCFMYGGSVAHRSSRRIRNPVVAALSPYQTTG